MRVKNVRKFTGVEMRMPIDISVMRRKTKKGVEEVVTTAEQRKQMRKELAKYPYLKIIEARKPAKPVDNLAWIDELEFFDAIFDDR